MCDVKIYILARSNSIKVTCADAGALIAAVVASIICLVLVILALIGLSRFETISPHGNLNTNLCRTSAPWRLAVPTRR